MADARAGVGGGEIRRRAVTIDTDTAVRTLYGHQMGGRKSSNPKNRGKRSCQPILTFLAETREYVAGELHNGDRPTGRQIARHLAEVFRVLPAGVETVLARAASGFYCWDAIRAYEQRGSQFIVSVRKTPRLVEQLPASHLEALAAQRRRRAV
jgi:hypothetical protein